jgi:hypothetical protein
MYIQEYISSHHMYMYTDTSIYIYIYTYIYIQIQTHARMYMQTFGIPSSSVYHFGHHFFDTYQYHYFSTLKMDALNLSLISTY